MANTSLEVSKLKAVVIHNLNGRTVAPDIATYAIRQNYWAFLVSRIKGWVRLRRNKDKVAMALWYEKPIWAVELWEKEFNLDFNCERRDGVKFLRSNYTTPDVGL